LNSASYLSRLKKAEKRKLLAERNKLGRQRNTIRVERAPSGEVTQLELGLRGKQPKRKPEASKA
jgi:hypothetical protein